MPPWGSSVIGCKDERLASLKILCRNNSRLFVVFYTSEWGSEHQIRQIIHLIEFIEHQPTQTQNYIISNRSSFKLDCSWEQNLVAVITTAAVRIRDYSLFTSLKRWDGKRLSSTTELYRSLTTHQSTWPNFEKKKKTVLPVLIIFEHWIDSYGTPLNQLLLP